MDFDFTSLIFPLMIFAVLYFFMIRPQQKLRTQQEDFQSNLSKGDEIVMVSGIIGRINKIDDKELTIETANKTFLRITRNAVSREMTESFFGDEEKA